MNNSAKIDQWLVLAFSFLAHDITGFSGSSFLSSIFYFLSILPVYLVYCLLSALNCSFYEGRVFSHFDHSSIVKSLNMPGEGRCSTIVCWKEWVILKLEVRYIHITTQLFIQQILAQHLIWVKSSDTVWKYTNELVVLSKCYYWNLWNFVIMGCI